MKYYFYLNFQQNDFENKKYIDRLDVCVLIQERLIRKA